MAVQERADTAVDRARLTEPLLAPTAIVVGAGLGIAVAFNVVSEYARQLSLEDLGLQVPWLTLALIFLLVYAVAATTADPRSPRRSHPPGGGAALPVNPRRHTRE